MQNIRPVRSSGAVSVFASGMSHQDDRLQQSVGASEVETRHQGQFGSVTADGDMSTRVVGGGAVPCLPGERRATDDSVASTAPTTVRLVTGLLEDAVPS